MWGRGGSLQSGISARIRPFLPRPAVMSNRPIAMALLAMTLVFSIVNVRFLERGQAEE